MRWRVVVVITTPRRQRIGSCPPAAAWHDPVVTSRSAADPHLQDLARLRRVRDRMDREYAQPLDVEALGTPFAAVDILPDPRIREELSAISGWPTIPQLFHKGELVGGCDIVSEMYESGELAEQLGVTAPEEAPEAVTPEGPPLTIENRLN